MTYLWKYYDGLHAVLRLDFLSPLEVQELVSRAYRRAYLKGRKILKAVWKALWRPREAMSIIRGGLVALRVGRAFKEYRRKLRTALVRR